MSWKDNFPKENRYFETENGILYKGDCLEILKDFQNESIDLVVTDPPYRTTARGNAGNSGGMLQKEINKKGKVFNHNDVEVKEWLPFVMQKLKTQTHFYIMTNHKNLFNYLNIINNIKEVTFIKALFGIKAIK